jgi:hypothetical protein
MARSIIGDTAAACGKPVAAPAWLKNQVRRPNQRRLGRNQYLSYPDAINLMEQPDTPLTVTRATDGDEYSLAGRRVTKDTAKKIRAHPDVVPFDEGLFPGNTQSWVLIKRAAA